MIFAGKKVLVTGGTGSLGKVLVRRLIAAENGTPEKVVVFSRDEAKQHEMRLSYMNEAVKTDEVIYSNFKNKLEFRIGDVRSYSDVCSALKGIDIVINAAALKQVPTCEYFPEQAVMTNCQGAMNIVTALREHSYGVETVVGVSTDKACKPVNVMGMTKAVQEKIFISANILVPETRFVCVRYGNVLASRGSVIPLFHEQIKNGGPITITNENMTRFLLSLDQAVDTIFAAIRDGQRGETFIPMAPTASVPNIAQALIGDRNIEIQVTGIRPGEKVHETLIGEEECNHVVRRGDYYAIVSMLPELQGEEQLGVDLDREFSSENDVLDLEQTIQLLRENNLLIGQVDLSSQEEILR